MGKELTRRGKGGSDCIPAYWKNSGKNGYGTIYMASIPLGLEPRKANMTRYLHAIRDARFEMRDLGFETRDLRLEMRGPRFKMRNSGFEIRASGAEI